MAHDPDIKITSDPNTGTVLVEIVDTLRPIGPEELARPRYGRPAYGPDGLRIHPPVQPGAASPPAEQKRPA